MRRAARHVLRRAAAEYNAGWRPDDPACADLEDGWEPPVLPQRGADRDWF
jgi:hypothetical protein